MISIITGDIVNSRKLKDQQKWIEPLKRLFQEISADPDSWAIYRGDSFQVKVSAEDALRIALLIKSAIIKLNVPGLDVRLAIGLGKTDHSGTAVNEATGEAHILSGTLLDQLTVSEARLGLQTPWPEINREFHMLFRLALVLVDKWTDKTADVAFILLSEQRITQKAIAEKLGLAQSTVNAHIKRGSLHEITELEKYYAERINEKLTEIRD